MRRSRAYIYLVSAAVIWGIAGVVVKFTLNGVPPLPFLTYRFLISGLIAIPFLLSSGRKINFTLKTSLALITYALFSTTIALGLLFLGVEKTTVLNLSLITIVAPLLVEVAGVIFFHERITHQEKIGSAIAVAGSMLTVIEPILENGRKISGLEGNLFILAYLMVEVVAVLILKRLLNNPKISPQGLTHFSFAVGLLSLFPIIAFTDSFTEIANTIINLPLHLHAGVWYMAVFSGTIAYTLRAKGQKTIEVGEAALFSYLSPIFSIPLAVIWLNEKVSPLFVLGGIIIAFGVFIAERKKR